MSVRHQQWRPRASCWRIEHCEGVTIDLSGMNNVTLSPDKRTAVVGPGAKWIQVYSTLDPLGYPVPGGRAGDVGVRGLVSGGR